jgi:hypothetical protein
MTLHDGRLALGVGGKEAEVPQKRGSLGSENNGQILPPTHSHCLSVRSSPYPSTLRVLVLLEDT